MPWVRFEDQFPIHRKVAAMKDAAYRVHTEAIFWCSRNLTDGIIRAAEINQIRPRADKYVAEIVDREAWHPAEQVCPSCLKLLADAGRAWPPDGWVIHDYLKFQPSRAQVIKDRDAKTKRQQKWRAAKRGGVDGDVDASVDGAVDPAPGDASPAPPRPAPKEAGREPRATARRRSAADAGGGGRRDQNHADPPPVDWRSLPAAGVPREPQDAERARRGAAAVRANLRRPRDSPRRDAFAQLRAVTDPPTTEDTDADDQAP